VFSAARNPGTGKAAMLTSLQVTVDGAPLPFNPTVAADVE
jgi:hypothetical protein